MWKSEITTIGNFADDLLRERILYYKTNNFPLVEVSVQIRKDTLSVAFNYYSSVDNVSRIDTMTVDCSRSTLPDRDVVGTSTIINQILIEKGFAPLYSTKSTIHYYSLENWVDLANVVKCNNDNAIITPNFIYKEDGFTNRSCILTYITENTRFSGVIVIDFERLKENKDLIPDRFWDFLIDIIKTFIYKLDTSISIANIETSILKQFIEYAPKRFKSRITEDELLLLEV